MAANPPIFLSEEDAAERGDLRTQSFGVPLQASP